MTLVRPFPRQVAGWIVATVLVGMALGLLTAMWLWPVALILATLWAYLAAAFMVDEDNGVVRVALIGVAVFAVELAVTYVTVLGFFAD